jgi:hypothetical protein
MSKEFQLIRETLAKLTSGSLGTYELDDVISIKCDDPSAEALRRIAGQIPDLFPPSDAREYCSEKGIQFIQLLLKATGAL